MGSIQIVGSFLSNRKQMVKIESVFFQPKWCFSRSTTWWYKSWEIRKGSTFILPDYEYAERLEMLCIPSVAKFLNELSQRHFSKRASASSHPLFSRIPFDNCRVSSRNITIYKPRRCHTQQLAKSFFTFFVPERNRWIFIYLFTFLSQSTCKHSLLSFLVIENVK